MGRIGTRRYILLAILALIGVVGGLFVVQKTMFTSAAPGINKTINFQGKMTDDQGLNVTDGSYQFVFRFYTVASGGSAVWTETVNLNVVDGIFQHNLGSSTALPGSVDFNTDNIFLGITFNSDPDGEMTPRVQLTATPYAFNSDQLDGLDASDFVQLSPSVAQTGNINITGSVTAGSAALSGNLTAGGTGSISGALTLGTQATTTAHAVRADRSISTNNGLTGGGNLTANRTIGLTGQALALHNLSANGIIVRTGSGTVASRTITAGTGVSVTSGDGVAGDPVIALDTSHTDSLYLQLTGGTLTGSLTLPASSVSGAPLNIPHGTAPTTPVNGDIWTTTTSIVARINGTSRTIWHNGNLAAVSQAEAEAGTATTSRAWTAQRVNQAIQALAPVQPGDLHDAVTLTGENYLSLSNQQITANAINLAGTHVTGVLPLTNGGTGATNASGARTNLGATTVGANFFTLTNPGAITFARINADNTISTLNAADFRTAIGAGTGNGTVTSIATNNGITGGTITSTGTIGLTGQALALHNHNTNGIMVRTGSGTYAGRSITSGTGISVTNGNGVSGNPTISLDTTHTDSLYVQKAGDTMTGNLILDSTDTTTAPLNIPRYGTTDPATTNDGDIWYRSNNLYYNNLGTTRTIAHTSSWSVMSVAEIETGTATTSRFMRADRLVHAIQFHAPVQAAGSGLALNGTTMSLDQQGASNGQVLKWNGTAWAPDTDNNTTYSAGTGLSLAGTTFNLANTAVTPGTYGSATQVGQFTVDAQGRLTAASSTSISIPFSQTTGTLAVNRGGTGATNASGARTNLGLGSLATLNTINNSNWSGTDLSVANGGTGASNAQGAINNISGLTTQGDLLYHNGTNSTRLARGSTNQCLTSTGSTIQWASCSTGGGITGSGTNGQIAYFNGSGTITSSADLLFDGTTLTANDAHISTLAVGGDVTVDGSVYLKSSDYRISSNTSEYLMELRAPGIISFNVGGGDKLAVGASGPMLIGHTTIGISSANRLLVASQVLNYSGSNFMSLQGATDNSFTTSLAVVDPTANRTITFPNASGTVAVSASGNIALSAAGNITFTGTLPVTNGGTGATNASGARTNLGLGSLATLNTINNSNWSGTDLAVANGGTGASNAQGAINNLSGLTAQGDLLYHNGTNSTRLARGSNGQCLMSNATTIIWSACAGGISSLGGQTGATQTFANDTNVTISSSADVHTLGWTGSLSVARGGTGATNAAGARTNLGLGSLATLNTVNNSNWSGTDLSVANGGTGVSTLTGVVIGNGASAMSGVAGTASQFLRRNAANSAYEFASISPAITLGADLSGSVTLTNLASGTLNATIASNAVSNANFRDSTALSVIGRATNSTGDPADIAAASDGQVLRRSGTTLGFGAINLGSANAVSGTLANARLTGSGALTVTAGTGLSGGGSVALGASTTINLAAATATVLGGVELFSNTVQAVAANAVSATASRTYGIQLNSGGQAVVNVPWVDTNTTYTGTDFIQNQNSSAQTANFWVSGNGRINGNLQLGDDVVLSRGAANRLDLASGDSLRIVSGALNFGADVSLSRGAANRLDLASGDSLNLVSGNIQQNGTNRLTSTGLFQAANGAAGGPAYSFSSDTNTGMYLIAADTLGFSAGGSERLRVTTSGVSVTGALDVSSTTTLSGNVISPSAAGYTVGANMSGTEWIQLDRRFAGTGNGGVPHRVELEVTGEQYHQFGRTVYFIDFRDGPRITKQDFNGGAGPDHAVRIYSEDAIASGAENKHIIGVRVTTSGWKSFNVRARELSAREWVRIATATEPTTGYTNVTPSIIYAALSVGNTTIQGTPADVSYGSVQTVLATATGNNANVHGSLSRLFVEPTSASTRLYMAMRGHAESTSSNIGSATLNGVYGSAVYSGTGAVNTLQGMRTIVSNTSSGAVTQAMGLFVTGNTNSGGGTITTNYGAFIQNQTAGTNNYGLYIEGASTRALHVNSGSTYLGGALDVTGVISGNGSGLTSLNAGNISTGTLAVARGGTGATNLNAIVQKATGNFAASRLLVTNGNHTATVLAAGTAGQCLTSTGASAPAWGACGITGSGANGRVAYYNGTGTITSSANLQFNGAALNLTGTFTLTAGHRTYWVASNSSNQWAVDNDAGSLRIFRENFGGGSGSVRVTIANAGTGTTNILGTTSCNIGSGTGSTNCTSDSRLKNNIQATGGNLSKVLHLNPVSYYWNEDSTYTTRIGLIAQEVMQYFPEAVSTDNDGYYTLDYGVLVSPLIGAVKELHVATSHTSATLSVVQNEISAITASLGGFASASSVQSLYTNLAQRVDLLEQSNIINLAVSGSATIAGDLTVSGTIYAQSINLAGKLITAGDLPTGTVLGDHTDHKIITIEGNDTAGEISFEIAEDAKAELGQQLSIEFVNAFGAKPRVNLTPLSAAAANIRYYVESTPQGFTLFFTSAPPTGETYRFSYFIVQ